MNFYLVIEKNRRLISSIFLFLNYQIILPRSAEQTDYSDYSDNSDNSHNSHNSHNSIENENQFHLLGKVI